MIAEKIRSVGLALGVLAGKVDEEVWNLVKMARGELSDAADTVEELEAALVVPRKEETPRPYKVLRAVHDGNSVVQWKEVPDSEGFPPRPSSIAKDINELPEVHRAQA